jgi:tetratricopeptide (TPR) repeat protein
LHLLVFYLLISAGQVPDPRPNPLAEARAAYNAGQFQQAVDAAERALLAGREPDAARLVIARARLELFRAHGEPASFDAARDALRRISESALSAQDRVEYLVGLGEALYLDDPPRFGAAAEFFELALAPGRPLQGTERERVFEWWAIALDRQAQFSAPPERRAIYQRLLRGAEGEHASHPESAVAWYWLALASRGADDVERAWSYAVAAWIRAPQFGDRGATLREDLDRLVTQVILPDRARRLSPDGDPRDALAILEGQWQELKKKWSGGT